MTLDVLVTLWLRLWRAKRTRTVAIVILPIVAVATLVWFYQPIGMALGRFGLALAQRTGVLNDDDPLAAVNAKIDRAKARSKNAVTEEDRSYYREHLQLLAMERAEIQAELAENVKKKAFAGFEGFGLTLTYSSLERIEKGSEKSFEVVPVAPNTFSVEWQFSSYVIRNRDAKAVGNPILRDTTPISDVVNAGKGFYLAGVRMNKRANGVVVANGFGIWAFEPKREREKWLAAKILLEKGDMFVGTIMTGISPNVAETLIAMVGANLMLFPLSLEDDSFPSVRVKDLTEKYGLVSLAGIMAPVMNPFLASKYSLQRDLEMGGKMLSDYHMLAITSLDSRVVAPLIKHIGPVRDKTALRETDEGAVLSWRP